MAATWLLCAAILESVLSFPWQPFSVCWYGTECTFAYVWDESGDARFPPPPGGACNVCWDELEFSWLFDLLGRNVFFRPSNMFLLGLGDPPILPGDAPLCVLPIPREPGAVFLFSSLGFPGSFSVGLVGQEVFLSSSCFVWSPVGRVWGACFPCFPPLWAGCDWVFRRSEFFEAELDPNSGADLKERFL